MGKTNNNEAAGRRVVRKIIALPPALKKQIMREVGCSLDTVRNALVLSNPRTGDQPDRIRRRALELGGVETTDVKWIKM